MWLVAFTTTTVILCSIVFRYKKFFLLKLFSKKFESFLIRHRRYFPSVERKVQEKMQKVLTDLQKDIHKTAIPDSLSKRLEMDHSRIDGKLSGAVYGNSEKLAKVFGQIAEKFSYVNPLHSDLYQATRQMEAEVIDYCKHLMLAPKNSTGVMTSGGTESIILAVKAYRDYWRSRVWFSWLRRPNIVAPVSVHAAFDKAADLMGINLIKVPTDCFGKANVHLMGSKITGNTICIVGSAPSFAHGIMDPVPELAGLAESRGVPLHMDACLGGFLIPWHSWGRLLHFQSMPGVTSVSMDTHKYGLAPKGSSVLLFRDKELAGHCYFTYPRWQGGIYATPTLAGSRPATLVASTWAAINECKYEYENTANKIGNITEEITKQVKSNDLSIEVIGKPYICVVAFRMKPGHDPMHIYKISDEMSKRGWNLNNLQNPPAFHLCITGCHTEIPDFNYQFMTDLKDSVSAAENSIIGSEQGVAAIYGMSKSIPTELAEELTKNYLTLLYET